ncbi:TonB-dependent receptor [Tenacibaculum sp. M341]|uniref:TonB-dependent receptor n=1 Tax=Tenacibaculum sp. M341 TaxID=2530339 RepID=UPI0010491F26|nr:TonB-dependent receptor [Tenacibaculum sp. M341]TCI85876.1 TonB-dependent receptor [Tenacibaculum sp. M341]
MRKRITLLSVFLCFLQVYSQQQKNISITLSNTSILESIQLIEKNTSYQFFFIDSWLASPKKVNKEFKNTTIDTLLRFIFDETNVNYFITEGNKIILSNNNVIYESVYRKQKVDVDVNIDTTSTSIPVFIAKSNFEKKKANTIKTIKIGKENNRLKQRKYTLKGVVKNKATKAAISDLVLLVRKTNTYAVTDKSGNFTIKLPHGIHLIETILSGIKTTKTRFIIYGDGSYNFNLSDDDDTLLNEVVVKSNRLENVKSLVTGVSQIKSEKVKVVPQVLGERNLLKIATTLPGIKSAGEASEGIHVRGGKSDQNLFLLDNNTIYNPTHFFGIFSAVNPFTTKDLKIYKGNIPARYGGRLSSVFDIVSKKSDTEKIKGEMSLGLVSSNLSAEIPVVKGKSGLIVGGRSSYSNWILRALDNKELRKSSASFYDVIAKYDHQINDNNSLNGTFFYSNDAYSIASDTTNAYSNKLVSLKWAHKFNEKNYGSIQLSNSNYAFKINFDGQTNTNFDLRYNIDEFQMNLNMNYVYSDKHKFNYGVASKLYQINPGVIEPFGNESIVSPFTVPQEKALESSLFIADDFTINEKLSASIGARYTLYTSLGASTQRIYDDTKPKSDASVIATQEFGNNEIQKTYNGLSLRLSTRYLLNKNLSVKASFNNSYQFIHRLSNNASANPTDTWTLSNINVKPQQSMQGALGVYKNLPNDIEISMEGYYRKYKNLVDYKVGASFLLNEFIETEILQGPGESYGLEFLLRKNSGKLNGWFGYNYSRSFIELDGDFPEEVVNDGNPFPSNFDQPHDFNLVANYKLTDRYSISTNFTYQTGRPVTYPIGKYSSQGSEFIVFSDRNEFRIPDYYRLDLGVNIEGNHKLKKAGHSFWTISVYNVLGRNNPYSVFFTTEDGVIQSYQSSIFSRPIPTISYNLKF